MNNNIIYLCGPILCSFLGCNLSIPFSLGEAVPLSGETGSCETKYYIMLIRITLFYYHE